MAESYLRRRREGVVAAPGAVAWPVIVLLATCLLALVSTLGASQQLDAVDGAAVMLGVAALVAAFGLSSRPEALVPRTRLGFAWTAFLGWALLSAVLSSRIWAALMGEVTSLLGWFTLMAVTLVAVAAARFGRGARLALEVAAPVVVFGEVVATIVQLTLGDTPRGSLPNSTYLGEAVLLLLPFVMAEDSGALRLERRHRLWLAGSAAITLAAAGSRVSAVVAIGWFLWVLASRSGLSRSLKTAAAAATIIAVAVGAITFARAEVLGSSGVETLGQRPQMWRTALEATTTRPLLGYGPDGFMAGGVAVTTPEWARQGAALVFRPGAVDPHSIVIWVLVSAGAIGLALLVWALVELCFAWRARARLGADVAPGVFAVVGALLVFLTAPAALQVLPLFGFVLGVSLCGDDGDLDGSPQSSAVGRVMLVLATLSVLTMTVNAATRLALEEHGPEVSPAKVRLAQAATDLWRFDAHLAYLASLHWGWVAAANPAVASAQPDLVAIERAYAVDGRDPFVAFERARTLRFYGAPNETIEAAFLSTFDRWSLFPLARAEYAVFLAQNGRFDEAREQIAIARLVDDPDMQATKAIEAAEAEMAAGK
ncbi:MAG: hypothetical protein U1E26_02475 [Coriobacteriia bacterium]|nr:hypothetical protein [Coriobacteriia bacterium]